MTKQSSINSKNKGKVGEWELAHRLCNLFPNHRFVRSGQVSGLYVSDVVEVDDNNSVVPNGLFIESKRVEALSVPRAIAKASADAKPNEIAAVFHRGNRQPWLVTVRLDDVIAFAERVIQLRQSGTDE